MEKNNFIPLWDNDISKSIHDLVTEGSRLKVEIFKPVVRRDTLDKRNIKFFESHINGFLKFWNDHAESLESAIQDIRDIPNVENIVTIEYEHVKSFIYAKYDYSSVLKFTDGIVQGIESETLKKPEHIEGFKDHTINMAFNNQDPTVAGLLDSVTRQGLGSTANQKVSTLEAKMFDTVRNYSDLFGKNDRSELYRAVTKVIEYVVENEIIKEELNYQNVRMFVSLINNVVEYILYSLATYAARIYIISSYCQPFIRAYESSSTSASMEECTELTDISENPKGAISSVFHATDEMIVKDPNKSKEFFERFIEFLKHTGADSLFDQPPAYSRSYYGSELNGNKFYEKLQDNPLYNLVKNCTPLTYYTTESQVSEIHQNLKSFLFNQHQWLQGTSSPRQEFLHVIRGAESGDNLTDYKKLAKDLYVISIDINHRVSDMMKSIAEKTTTELKENNLPIVSRKLLAECTSFLINWYEEVMFAFAQKAGYIERKINDIRKNEIDKFENMTSLDIKDMKSDLNLTDSMTLSVPSTLRMPMEFLDLYSLPIFEEYQMYSEWLKYQPEFADDLYFSEAGLSVGMNKIMAILDGLVRMVVNFFNSRQLGDARKWVTANKSRLLGLNITTAEWLPFKENIGPPAGFDNLKNGLTSFNPNEDTKNIDEFIKKLYPDNMYEVFTSNKDTAAITYKNYILYDNAHVTDKTKEAQVVKFNDPNDIKKHLNWWIISVEKSGEIVPQYQRMYNDLKTAINSINTKLVSLTSKEQQTSATPGEQKTDAGAGGSVTTDNSTSIQTLTTGINTVILNVWSPLTKFIIDAIKIQYGYLKEVHSATKQPEAPKPSVG